MSVPDALTVVLVCLSCAHMAFVCFVLDGLELYGSKTLGKEGKGMRFLVPAPFDRLIRCAIHAS